MLDDPFVGEHYAAKVFLPTRAAWVIPLTFGRARIVVGLPGSFDYYNSW